MATSSDRDKTKASEAQLLAFSSLLKLRSSGASLSRWCSMESCPGLEGAFEAPEPLVPGRGPRRQRLGPSGERREERTRGDGGGAVPEALAHYAGASGEIRVAALLYRL